MAIVRATVRLHRDSNMAIDDSVNVWHFQGVFEPFTPGDSIAVADALSQFYESIYMFYGSQMIRGIGLGMTTEFANVVVGAAGPDDDVISKVLYSVPGPGQAFPAAVGDNYPEEVAVCLSFSGDIQGISEESGQTRPASRRRGRIYLGPLTNNIAWSGSGHNIELPATGGAILDAYEAFIANLQTIADPPVHIVYSPTSAVGYPIRSASVDNAFDTMRSRGRAPTDRLVRSITQA